jgi:hypothetical protein
MEIEILEHGVSGLPGLSIAEQLRRIGMMTLCHRRV